MSSQNQIALIDKLKGRENFDAWKFAVQAYLLDLDLWDCVSGECKTNPCKKDVKARAKIILLVDQVNYVHLQSTKTAKEAWDTLESAFQDSGLTRRVGLLRTLITTRLENCDSVEDFVNKIVTTAYKLTNMGLEVSDEWVGTILLAGLPDNFQPMIMGIESSGIQITADSIKTKLLQDVSTVKQSNCQKVSAMYGQQRKSPSYNKFQKNTRSNTVSGTSYVSYNPKNNGSRSNQNNSSGSKSKGPRCFECNGYGHFSKNCSNHSDRKERNGNNNSENMLFMALSAQISSSETNWYLDSGCSAHLTNDKNAFVSETTPTKLKISTASSDEIIQTNLIGDITLPITVDDNTLDVSIRNVYYVPDLRVNLLSISQIVKSGNSVIFNSKGARVVNVNNKILATATLENGLFKLDKSSQSVFVAQSNSKKEELLWHQRMAHINFPYLSKLNNGLVHGMKYSDKISKDFICDTCTISKSHRLPFTSSESKSTEILDLIHSDLVGPLDKSLGGSQYMLTFLDDHSHMTFCYFLAKKSEVFDVFVNFKNLVENQTNHKIKIFRTDNGGEFCSDKMNQFLCASGIQHQTSVPHTPEQNGKAERLNRTILEKVRCLLKDSELPDKFWAEAANTACYLLNRSPTKCTDATPLQIWTGKKPTVKHVRMFGCKMYAHISDANRRKLDPKSHPCIFLGYSDNSKAYRLYDPVKKEFLVSRDVIVSENEKGSTLLHESEKTQISIPIIWQNQENESNHDDESIQESTTEQDSSDLTENDSDDPSYHINLPLINADQVIPLQRKQRLKRQPDKLKDYVTYAMALDEPDDPITVEETKTRPDRHLWKQAMDLEFQSLLDNGTWELVDLPHGKIPLKSKWVFRTKRDVTGKIVKHKARLVVKGCAQKKGIDFEETFSPVARYSSIRYLLALAAKRDMEIDQMDAISAFLQGDLTEEIYMCQPEGYQDSGKVCRLKKSIYGLKQASRIWNVKLDASLKNSGLKQSKFDPCVYFKTEKKKMVIVVVWVDDLLIFSDDQKMKQEIKSKLMKNFKMTDIGEAKYVLGFQITRDRPNKKLWIDQKVYIENVLSRFGMENCNFASTPLDFNVKLSKDQQPKTPEEKEKMEDTPYQEAVGSLLFASQVSRPDIAYAVSLVSRFNNNPGPMHWSAVKRILRYMKGTVDWKLMYDGNKSSEITGFCDSDFASDVDERKSVTGYVFLMCGGSISWGTKKQPTTALSTTEAEYMSLSAATQEALWLRGLSKEIVSCSEKIPLKIFVDNQGALNLAHNGCYQSRTKHIDVRHHFLREKISEKLIKPIYIPTNDMVADSLTKPLCSVKFSKCIQLQGITK